jgi:acetyltransferase-like isoleucine patch superfamily enzyme
MSYARWIGSATILGTPEIGKDTWIGYNVVIEAINAKVIIGKHCSISSGVNIVSHSSHLEATLRGDRVKGDIIIGDNVFIGTNSVILGNVKIGSGSIIGALSLVKDIDAPPNSLIVGIPAVIK